eukprot:Skav226003  [mRNA]  locus=scaffold1010:23315:25169:- [translate_table: standard]
MASAHASARLLALGWPRVAEPPQGQRAKRREIGLVHEPSPSKSDELPSYDELARDLQGWNGRWKQKKAGTAWALPAGHGMPPGRPGRHRMLWRGWENHLDMMDFPHR